MKTLILGGARSGKSRLAERWAGESAKAVTYLATATAEDDEMRARIAAHRARRPATWHVVEEPLALAQALRRHAQSDGLLLVDCLTLWLSNLLLHPDPACFQEQRTALLAALAELPGDLLLVSNETGMGVVPMGALARRFCDEAGWLHQELAQRCERVILVVAGLPHPLKAPA